VEAALTDSGTDTHGPGTLRLAAGALGLVARSSPRGFGLAVALQVLGAAAAAALVLSARLTLEGLLRPSPTLRDIVLPLVVLAVASTLGSVVSGWQVQQQRLLGEDAARTAWTRLLAVTSRVDLRVIQTPAFADRVERIQEHALGRPSQIADACLTLIGSSISLLTLVVAVLALQPLLVPLLLIAGIPTVVLSRVASRTEFDFYRRWGELARRRHYLRTLLGHQHYAHEVRAFGTQERLEHRHHDSSMRYRRALRVQVRRRQILALAGAALAALALSATLGVIAWLVASGRMSLARAGAAVIAVRLLAGQIDRFFAAVNSIVEAAPFLADLQALLAEADLPAPTPERAWPLRDGLSLRDVRFRYDADGPEVLRGIDLDIRAGEVVALVGENGSGKSTLAKIVSGLYRPAAGEVSWDGRRLDDVDRPGLRRSVTTLFQDFIAYDFTAADNIELEDREDREDGQDLKAPGGAQDLKDAQAHAALRARIEAAAEDAGIAERIRTLPDGFDAMLGLAFSGGQELSGGQWQRVALARAAARDSPLVVLDEPTSSLDPRAEQALFADLRKAFDGRAVLLVSHRYGNLHLADRIYVLQDGAVVEQGGHRALVARDGLYAELYRLQSVGTPSLP
jgi:ATP-binding cassette subfamily B protein